jgi:hypothetical protein
VFGTLAADGRRHAHRIYVAPGGAGKADLGTGPAGRPREPKKSARVAGEAGTAGCAVLWGDPAEAPHLLLAEGIETGAAVALAVAPEIEAGRVAVAAAVSAAGMEAFEPWPATRRVTVAADRDEGDKPDGRPGYGRGGLAARTFALRHRERVEVAVALPGARAGPPTGSTSCAATAPTRSARASSRRRRSCPPGPSRRGRPATPNGRRRCRGSSATTRCRPWTRSSSATP